MKKTFTFLIALMLACATAFGFSGSGSGTSGDPYLVTSAAQLNEVRNNFTAYYKQTVDIDISGYSNWTKIGNTTTAGDNFTGTYDGNGFKITGLSITSTASTGNGLFGVIGSGGTVKNLGVSGSVSGSNAQLGLLVGYNFGGTIENCYSTGSVTTSSNNAGGLIGTTSGTVSKCYSTAAVTATGALSSNIGGLAGSGNTTSSTISESYSTGNVSNSTTGAGSNTGGFIGLQPGNISNCYSTGNVTSSAGGRAGGFMGGTGAATGPVWSNCYSTGLVTCAVKGGFIGYYNVGTFSNCYFDYNTAGTSNTYGTYQTSAPTGITAKTTTEMKTASTFSSWSSSYWYIATGSYPKLLIEFATPTVTGISPTNGSTAGGTSIVITGTNLTSATAVHFGSNTATITANAATSITATSPTGSAGTIDITVTTPGGTSATSGSDQFTYLTPGTFTGAVSSDWATAGNWVGGVPTSSTNVTIASDKTVVIGVTTSADCNNLTVTGTLTIQSSTSGTGSLIVHGTSSGNVNVQRYMSSNAWHIVSPTAAGGSISTFIQNAPNSIPTKDVSGTIYYGMKDYNETTNLWNGLFTAVTPGNLVSVKGYCLRRSSDGIVTFTGTLVSGTQTFSLTKSGEGWNCIGNPYPSAINMNNNANISSNFLLTNSTNLDPSYACVYVWDDAAAEYKILGNSSFGSRDLGQNVFTIGQGFFVKANSSSSSVQFTTAMQAHQNSAALKSSNISWPGVELTVTSGLGKASTVVAFNSKMTNGLDPTYDAGLLRGSSGLNLYSRLVNDNGIDFAIQCLPEDYDNLEIPIGLDCKTGGKISFCAETSTLPTTCSVILEDRVNKTNTVLDNGAEYVTTVTDGIKGTGRFYIHTSYLTTGIYYKIATRSLNLKVYQADRQIYITGEIGALVQAQLFDINGKKLGSFKLQEGNKNIIPAFGLAAGVYFLNITEAEKHFATKIVIY